MCSPRRRGLPRRRGFPRRGCVRLGELVDRNWDILVRLGEDFAPPSEGRLRLGEPATV